MSDEAGQCRYRRIAGLCRYADHHPEPESVPPANERTTFYDAFAMADEVLHQGVCGVTDLMIKPGLINLDFADIRTVMSEMGKATMGTGEASGDNRATNVAEAAINNLLLDETTMKGAQAYINITGGSDMTLFEVDEVANHIRREVDAEATIIFGLP